MADAKSETPGGTRFGGYELDRVIGRGGMGVVYLARDLALDREVALKVLREELRSQAHLVSRFQREARAAASLTHPNIVHIHSVGIVGDTPYIAMDYIDGRPLSAVLQEEGRLDWKRALAIGEQVADALSVAHDAQIVHRDIKPANILIDTEDHAYVTDFGVAKILTADTQLTVDGTRIGTPHYMSPERCRNEETSTSSDIYSLGVVLFQLMTARLPYEAQNSVDLINKIIFAPPSRLRDFVADMPEEVERLVAYLIEKKPQDRPATPRIAHDAIARVRAGRPLDETDSTLAEALEAFRHTMDTPGSAKNGSQGPSKPTFRDRIERYWQLWWDVPAWTQALAWISGAAFLIFALAAAFITSSERDRHYPATWLSQRGSGWTAQENLAQFYNDSPQVTLASLQAPDFGVTPIGWAGSAGLLTQLDGGTLSSWHGYWAMAVLSPDASRGLWTFPPVPVGNGQEESSIHLLDIAPSGDLLFRVTRRHDHLSVLTIAPCTVGTDRTTRVLMRGGIKDIPAPFDPANVAQAAFRPDGKALAVAITLQDEQCLLTEWPLQGPDTPLTKPGLPIRSIEYSPDGTELVYLEENGRQSSTLRVVRGGDASGGPRTLAEGKVGLSSRPFSPDSKSVAYWQNADEALVVSLSGDSSPVSLGKGTSVTWHPSGRYLLVAAPDASNTTQIWAVEAAQEHRRTQLTSADTGIMPQIYMSPDGMWAAARTPGVAKPWVVFVHLTSVAFS